MTSKERISRILQHKEADRVPMTDTIWTGTNRRWEREGMPKGMDWRDYFDVDKMHTMSVDVSPRYEKKILEETDRYYIETSQWGVTMKHFKEEDSTPEFLDFTVVTPEKWEETKKRMQPDRDRIDWKFLEENYPKWKAADEWIEAGFWFGFDVTHSGMVGTETLLIAMAEEPEWVKDMFETELDLCISLFDMLLDAGYRFDSIIWPDDMGYKNTPFFSTTMYRELLKPFHAKAIKWAHEHDMYAHLHSCGDIMPLIPDILETGVDILNPLEIKAGMDAIKLKEDYGDTLTLHGGINAQNWDKIDVVIPEIERLVPILKEKGGYIFSSDHSIPNSVSLETFRKIIETAKRVGKY